MAREADAEKRAEIGYLIYWHQEARWNAQVKRIETVVVGEARVLKEVEDDTRGTDVMKGLQMITGIAWTGISGAKEQFVLCNGRRWEEQERTRLEHRRRGRRGRCGCVKGHCSNVGMVLDADR